MKKLSLILIVLIGLITNLFSQNNMIWYEASYIYDGVYTDSIKYEKQSEPILVVIDQSIGLFSIPSMNISTVIVPKYVKQTKEDNGMLITSGICNTSMDEVWVFVVEAGNDIYKLSLISPDDDEGTKKMYSFLGQNIRKGVPESLYEDKDLRKYVTINTYEAMFLSPSKDCSEGYYPIYVDPVLGVVVIKIPETTFILPILQKYHDKEFAKIWSHDNTAYGYIQMSNESTLVLEKPNKRRDYWKGSFMEGRKKIVFQFHSVTSPKTGYTPL